MSEFRPDVLTWAGLLGRWIEFAQASVALPHDADGERWRKSITPIINLQAVTFALGDLTQLDQPDRPHGRDRAAVLIRECTSALFEAWAGQALPPMVREVMDDADNALERSYFAGVVELVWSGNEPIVMPTVDLDLDAGGTLAVMQPGTIVIPNEPVAWWVDRDAPRWPAPLDQARTHEPEMPKQVYRKISEDGRVVRDRVQSVLDEPPDWLPLIVPLLQDGRTIGSFTLNAEEWEAAQRRGMDGNTIPVEVVEHHLAMPNGSAVSEE